MKHTIREELLGVFVFVGVVWCLFLVGLVIPWNINSLGLTPRSLVGLAGIPLMPFLHENLRHLLSNTVPLIVLLLLLAGSNARSRSIVVYIVLIGGVLLWIFGRPATHIGASGLVYGLIAFLIVSGLLERRLVPLLISIVVGFVYGGTLLSGIVPDLGSHVSWEGHLFGAVAGGLVAGLLTRRGKQPEPDSEGHFEGEI
jgi:membrane associated rhomboid family serine protease